VDGLKSMQLDTGSLFDLSYIYDPLGNVAEVVDGHSTALGDCNTSLSDCDDASATYNYDVRNRLSSWTRTAGGTETKHFAYDTLGNLVGRDLDNAGDPWNQIYGNASQPHQLTTSHSLKVYSYDASGNVKQKDGVYFTYNSANQLVCQGSSPGTCDVTFTYDMDGNQLSRTSASSQEFFFEKLVRWIPRASSDAHIDTFAFGRRLVSHFFRGPDVTLRTSETPVVFLPADPTDWSDRLWLAGVLLGMASLLLLAQLGAFETMAKYPAAATLALTLTGLLVVPHPLWGMGGGGSGTGINERIRYVFQDHRGTEVLTTDEAGAVKQWRVFEPFGEKLASAELSSFTDQRFEGHRWDEGLGLYNFGARWYDSDAGRFMSVDPLIPDVANPQNHNPYGYVRNNPINMVDPTGMASTKLTYDGPNGSGGNWKVTPGKSAGNVSGTVNKSGRSAAGAGNNVRAGAGGKQYALAITGPLVVGAGIKALFFTTAVVSGVVVSEGIDKMQQSGDAADDDGDLDAMEESGKPPASKRKSSGRRDARADADQQEDLKAEQAAKRKIGRGDDINSTDKSDQRANTSRSRIRSLDDALEDLE
jgi:RHS repeat-associated protein